jgi:hypothetical protein
MDAFFFNCTRSRRVLACVLFCLWVVAPRSASALEIGLVTSVEADPAVLIAGQPGALIVRSSSCYNWQPGWTATVSTPESDLILVVVSADLRAAVCTGNLSNGRIVSFVAPAAGEYRVRVVGGGLFDHQSPTFAPSPYAIRPYTRPTPLTILGGPPPAVVVPVSVMSPWAIGGLVVLLALMGHLVLRVRGRISG